MEETSTITFEKLYDLVRKEKTNEEIQELNPETYKQLVDYLNNKIQIYKEAKEKNLKDTDQIKIQIVSARKLIKEFYERRERKILHLAINKSRTKQADDSRLLDQEKPILNESTEILNKYRKEILLNLVNAKLPCSETQEQPIEVTQEGKPETLQNNKEPEIIQKEPETVKIKFTGSVPKFLGKEMEIYGPFEPDDEITIDKDIANILINKEKAELNNF